MLVARRATPADLPAIRAITRAAYLPYVPVLGGEPPPMHMDYAPQVEAGESYMVAPEADPAPLATAIMQAEPDALVILNLAVHPDAQGAGAGRFMLDLAEARARHLRLSRLRLYTNPGMTRNLAIYARAGFTETGRRPNPLREGWILVDMARTLA